jgi:hypothetical protein
MTAREILSYYETSFRSLEDLNKVLEYLDQDKPAKDRWVRLDAVAKRL